MRLVVDEQRPRLAADLLESLEEARLGQHDADVRERRLGQHTRDVAAREDPPHALEIVELHHRRGLRGIDLRPDVARLLNGLAVLADDRDRLVDRPVVAPVEDEHLRPALDLARDPQCEAVGVRRGERELPVRHAEAPAQLLRDPDRVLGRHHRRHAAELADATRNRAHRRLRRVTGHRAGVAEREVDVLVAVDVGDAGAARLRVEERIAADPLRHPRHRNAEDLGSASLLGELERTRRALAEEPALPFDQRLQARALDDSRTPAHGRRACRRGRRASNSRARRRPPRNGYGGPVGTSLKAGAVRGGHPALAAALETLEQRLDALREEGRYRRFVELERPATDSPYVRLADGSGRVVVDWCSNDYLGMSLHPAVVEAAARALAEHGVGSGGTRNIAGSHILVRELEDELADLHAQESALVFTSGFIANEASLRALGSLLDGCIILSDERNHASMIDGIRASRAERAIFRHNDVEHLRELLEALPPEQPRIVAFESIYSMDGDIAPLREICALAAEHGALTYLDETHAAGAYGREGAGVAQALGAADAVDDPAGQPRQGLRDARRFHRRPGQRDRQRAQPCQRLHLHDLAAPGDRRRLARERAPPALVRRRARRPHAQRGQPARGVRARRRRGDAERRATSSRCSCPAPPAVARSRRACSTSTRSTSSRSTTRPCPAEPSACASPRRRRTPRRTPSSSRARSHRCSPRRAGSGTNEPHARQPQPRRALGERPRALDALLRGAVRLRAAARARRRVPDRLAQPRRPPAAPLRARHRRAAAAPLRGRRGRLLRGVPARRVARRVRRRALRTRGLPPARRQPAALPARSRRPPRRGRRRARRTARRPRASPSSRSRRCDRRRASAPARRSSRRASRSRTAGSA